MGSFMQWLGFNNPRDAPSSNTSNTFKLPDIQNNVRDSGTLFIFGKADSGEKVDEKTAMQIATVYACVRLLAESVASLPLHLYRSTDNNGGKEKAKDHPLYKICTIIVSRKLKLDISGFA